MPTVPHTDREEGSFQIVRDAKGHRTLMPLTRDQEAYVGGPKQNLTETEWNELGRMLRDEPEQADIRYPQLSYRGSSAMSWDLTKLGRTFDGWQGLGDSNRYSPIAKDKDTDLTPGAKMKTKDSMATSSDSKSRESVAKRTFTVYGLGSADPSEEDWTAWIEQARAAQGGAISAPVEEYKERVKQVVEDLEREHVKARGARRRTAMGRSTQGVTNTVESLRLAIDNAYKVLLESETHPAFSAAIDQECYKLKSVGTTAASTLEQIDWPGRFEGVATKPSKKKGLVYVAAHDAGEHRYCLLDSILATSADLDRELFMQNPDDFFSFAKRSTIACAKLAASLTELSTALQELQLHAYAEKGLDSVPRRPTGSFQNASDAVNMLDFQGSGKMSKLSNAVGLRAKLAMAAMKAYETLVLSDEAKKLRPDGGRIAGICDLANPKGSALSSCSGTEAGLMCGTTMRSVENMGHEWTPFISMAANAWEESVKSKSSKSSAAP